MPSNQQDGSAYDKALKDENNEVNNKDLNYFRNIIDDKGKTII